MKNLNEYSKNDLLRLAGSEEQLYSVKKYMIEDGKGKGSSIYQVTTGGKLQYDVAVDNAMDLTNLSYNGVNISYISKNGSVISPYAYENSGNIFGQTFNGGMLYTCGLRNTGSAVVENGKFFATHGRIHSVPSENCSAICEDGKITLKGYIRETELFGHSLELKRTITSEVGSSKIIIDDVLTNKTPEDEEYMIIYHMNFGFPFLSPALKMWLPENIETVPASEHAAEYSGRETEFTMPIDGEEETLFFHTSKDKGEKKLACGRLENPELGIGATVKYSVDTLPIMAQWRCMRSGEYVLGIEPTNSYVMSRTKERENGTIGMLPAFESVNMHVELEFYDL